MNFAGIKSRLLPALAVVVIVTLVFRLPSCRESFWLDELHSAWAVDDSLDVVGPRAVIGNQTTGYFHLLWGWKQCFARDGGAPIEFTLRLLGVTLSCLAAGVLTIGIACRTRRVAAGLVAGLIFAVDPNSVFFGCELRPYGLVMLLASLAVASMMAWLGPGRDTGAGRDTGPAGESAAGARPSNAHGSTATETHGKLPSPETRHSDARQTGARRTDARWRLAMLFWVCVAALVHPTSLGVLGWLIPLSVLAARARGCWQLGRADGVAALVILVTMVLLGNSSLASSWERRDLWKAFGQAAGWWQFQGAWDWIPLLIIPAAAAVLLMLSARIAEKVMGDPPRQNGSGLWQSFGIGLLPASAALIGTLLFFLLSYYQWVPLWHRRYFIAAFPLLVWTAGECVGIAMLSVERCIAASFPADQATATSSIGSAESHRLSFFCVRACDWLIVGAVLTMLLWCQSTLPRLVTGEIPLQERREPWREAVAAVREQGQAGDPVWLDSGLIEAAFLQDPVENAPAMTDAQWNYLSFPLAGPYRLDPVLVVSCQEHDSWLQRHVAMLPRGETTVWLVARASSSATRQFIDRLDHLRGVEATPVFEGNLKVIRLTFAP